MLDNTYIYRYFYIYFYLPRYFNLDTKTEPEPAILVPKNDRQNVRIITFLIKIVMNTQ